MTNSHFVHNEKKIMCILQSRQCSASCMRNGNLAFSSLFVGCTISVCLKISRRQQHCTLFIWNKYDLFGINTYHFVVLGDRNQHQFHC